jgi:hypothetical protein
MFMGRATQNQRLLHLSTSANECKNLLNEKLSVARCDDALVADLYHWLMSLSLYLQQ